MRQGFVGGLIGAGITGLVIFFLITYQETTVQAQGNIGAGAQGPFYGQNGIIALTGSVSNGVQGLWIVQTNAGVERDGTPSVKILLYLPSGVAGGVKLAGARNISYDLDPRFSSYKDLSEKTMSFQKMRDHIHELNQKELEKAQGGRLP